MRRAWRSGIAVVLLLGGCYAFDPQHAPGDIRGQVVTLQPIPLQPLARVRVRAKQAVAETWTDNDGRFRLQALPASWQDLIIEAEGYRPITRRILVQPAGVRQVTFHLQAEGEPLPPGEFLFERAGAIWQSDRWGQRQTRVSPEGKWTWRSPVWAPDRQRWAALAVDASPRTSDAPGIWVHDGPNGVMRTATLPSTPLGLSWQGGPFLVSLDSTGMNQGMGSDMLLAMVQRSGQFRFLSSGSGEGQPALSPDGRRIAYTLYGASPAEFLGTTARPAGRTQVVVANAGGADLRELTREGDNFDPAWSPDGRRIAFISNRAGGLDLWTMRPDGTDQQQLTFTGAKRAGSPCWSPDGRQIAFNTTFGQVYGGRKALDLWRVDVVSGEMTMISNDAVSASW